MTRSTKCQILFSTQKSTLQQLLLFVKHVLEPKCAVDVVHIDFCKAFDTVPHDCLLQKLKLLELPEQFGVGSKHT